MIDFHNTWYYLGRVSRPPVRYIRSTDHTDRRCTLLNAATPGTPSLNGLMPFPRQPSRCTRLTIHQGAFSLLVHFPPPSRQISSPKNSKSPGLTTGVHFATIDLILSILLWTDLVLDMCGIISLFLRVKLALISLSMIRPPKLNTAVAHNRHPTSELPTRYGTIPTSSTYCVFPPPDPLPPG